MASRSELAENYRHVMERVAAAARRSGRHADDVMTVAVTKTASPDQIRQLIELGHQDFGENRVQQLEQRTAVAEEFLARRRMLAPEGAPSEIRWHMIGHLQRNKVKSVIPLVKLIHSVDSLRLIEEIQTQAAKLGRKVDLLLQVKAASDPTKFGLAVPAVPHLAEQIDTMLHLRLRGLMTIAPYDDDPEVSRPIFEQVAELFTDMRKEGRYGETFNILSMGMSGDFEVAIECGANVVRLGRCLFGEAPEGEDVDDEDDDPADDD
ncbi:MAG: YggS family pyridoxal phosphate-dependent enzyme [Phycisphaera sp.]|nr:YggS family pyridoxal phosphate-dependent enzyme [Phycisphaera sp.]